jgi:hypothetical protein
MTTLIKRQTTCGNNSECGNGQNSTGNDNGLNNNVDNSGSSTTDRNIALGVGLGVGLPGAIVAMAAIINYFIKGGSKGKKKSSNHPPTGSNGNASRASQLPTSLRPEIQELGNDYNH